MILQEGRKLTWPFQDAPKLEQVCWGLYPLIVQALDVGSPRGRQVALGKAASYGQGQFLRRISTMSLQQTEL